MSMASYHRSVVCLSGHDSRTTTQHQRAHRPLWVTVFSHLHMPRSTIPQTCRLLRKCWKHERATDLRPCHLTPSLSLLRTARLAVAAAASVDTTSNCAHFHSKRFYIYPQNIFSCRWFGVHG